MSDIGAVLVEPVQGRGGIRVPPAGWLQAVADKARGQGRPSLTRSTPASDARATGSPSSTRPCDPTSCP